MTPDEIEREFEELMRQHTTHWRTIRYCVPALAARVRKWLVKQERIFQSEYNDIADAEHKAREMVATLQTQLDAREREIEGLRNNRAEHIRQMAAQDAEIERLKGALTKVSLRTIACYCPCHRAPKEA